MTRTFYRNLAATCVLALLAIYFSSRAEPNNEAAGALVAAIIALWTHSGRRHPSGVALLAVLAAAAGCSPEFSYHAAAPASSPALAAGVAGFDAAVGTPFTPYSCPSGKACMFANSTTSPARWRFIAGDGSVVDSGTALATALVAGTPAGVQTGYIWQDSTIGSGTLRYRSAGGTVSLAAAGAAPATHAASHKAGGSDDLLGAPGAIGGVTPAAGTFTALTATTSNLGTLVANLAFGGFKGTGAAAPTASGDLANKAYVDAAAPEIWFTRTCTITSAAATTPVTCLADAALPAGKSAHLMGWHAKVNGATAWATTANCYIADTSGAGGTGIIFVTMAVAALVGNAYVQDASANVTQGDAYSLNSGSTVDKGLLIECNANGTGSDLVVTLFGSIK